MTKRNKQWTINHEIEDRNHLLENILYHRGITEPDGFLNPDISYEFSYKELKNIEESISITTTAINNRDKILIILDTDVDGVMAGAMVFKYLKRCDANVVWKIGNNKKHGISQFDLEELIQFDLIIACDSLSNELETYELLSEHEVKIILLDHHYTETESYDAVTVNSEMFGYSNDSLSGAGVCYKFLQGLDDACGLKYADDYLDLACTGIIADMMDMTRLENRSICHRGFNNLKNSGLQEIIKGYDFTATSIIFSIAPLINACQRTGQNEIAAQIILSEDKKEIKHLISIAKQLREEQNLKVDEQLTMVQIQISELQKEGDKFVFAFVSDDAPTGLIAQKAADIYKKPAIIVLPGEIDESGEVEYWKGSIRSYGCKNFKEIVNETKLARAEGHSEAAGIYILNKYLKEFKEKLQDIMSDVEIFLSYSADIEILPNMIDYDLLERIQKVDRITGRNFNRLTFVIRDIIPEQVTVLKERHVKFEADNMVFLIWNDTSFIDEVIKDSECWGVDLLGNLEIGNFRGRKSVNFVVNDYIPRIDLDL